MTFDEIMHYVNSFVSTFGSVIDLVTVPVRQVVGENFADYLPNFIADASIFGLMFGEVFIIYFGYQFLKWVIGALD